MSKLIHLKVRISKTLLYISDLYNKQLCCSVLVSGSCKYSRVNTYVVRAVVMFVTSLEDFLITLSRLVSCAAQISKTLS